MKQALMAVFVEVEVVVENVAVAGVSVVELGMVIVVEVIGIVVLETDIVEEHDQGGMTLVVDDELEFVGGSVYLLVAYSQVEPFDDVHIDADVVELADIVQVQLIYLVVEEDFGVDLGVIGLVVAVDIVLEHAAAAAAAVVVVLISSVDFGSFP